MDKKLLKTGMENIIKGLGEKSDREGLKNTPERFTKMCEEIFAGYMGTPPEPSIFSSPSNDSMVIIKDIPYYSMCEHHFLPFFGEMHIAYLPQNEKITGFSEIVEVVRYFSYRLQIQERLTTQIADYLNEKLNPKGLLIISSATQLCMSMRGVKSINTKTEVMKATGEIKNKEKLLQEAISLLKVG